MARVRFSRLRRELLESLAETRGVDFDIVSLFTYGDDVPEPDQNGIAFGLLGCGGDALLGNTYADEFPAHGRTAKKGAKLLTRSLGGAQSIAASSLLAQTQAVLASERQLRTGNEADAAAHAACAELVQRHYPLVEDQLALIERQRATAWAWADEVRAREERGENFGEHAAEPMAAQRFQQAMTLHALEFVLGDWIDENLDHMILPFTLGEGLVRGMADAVSWGHIEERRMRLVRAAHASALI